MTHRLPISKMLRGLVITAIAGFACLSGAAFAQTEASPSSSPSTGPTPSPTETYFKTNCAMCHGPDGAGSVFGKRIGVPDLRSKEVQSTPPAALAKIIAGGKNNMPAFGTRLDNAQIQKLVDYIRQFHPNPDTK